MAFPIIPNGTYCYTNSGIAYAPSWQQADMLVWNGAPVQAHERPEMTGLLNMNYLLSSTTDFRPQIEMDARILAATLDGTIAYTDNMAQYAYGSLGTQWYF